MLKFSEEEKNQIIQIIKKLLYDEEKVIFTYIYGSFIEQDFSKIKIKK